MIIFKSLEYFCFWICNIDDTKVINWIYTWSNNLNQTNTKIRREQPSK